MGFAENLRQMRKAQKMTQKQLGEELGVALSTVGMWETGFRRPDLDMAMQIARYFDVSVDALIGGDEVSASEAPPQPEYTHARMTPELAELRQMLRTRPEMKMLFSVSKNASREDIERAVAIIEALKKSE